MHFRLGRVPVNAVLGGGDMGGAEGPGRLCSVLGTEGTTPFMAGGREYAGLMARRREKIMACVVMLFVDDEDDNDDDVDGKDDD